MADSLTTHHLFGTKDVSSAGTAVAVHSTSRIVTSLIIVAHSDNAGRIFYGASDVASTTQKGLAPGESMALPAPSRGTSLGMFDISTIFIDAANTNDGVDFVAALYVK